MANEVKVALSTDPSKINPTSASEEDLYEYQQSLQDQIKALEDRYAQPNWFKVAAGFAKPQLGGFTASLGSAAEALGENVEQQRAAQLPIAQMRSQLAQSNILTGQNRTQSQEYERWRASGKPMDAATYSRLVSLNPESAVAKAAKEFYTGAKEGMGIQKEIISSEARDPLMNLHQALFSNQGKSPEELKQIQDKIDQTRPPQIDEQVWSTMPRYAKMEAQEAYAKAQSEIGLSEEEKSREQAKSAYDRLPLLRNIRETALGFGVPDVKDATGKTVSGQEQMAGLLNYFGGNNPLEVIARAAADGKFGDLLAGIDTYARQSGMSPEARDNFQKLVKMLNENQIKLRGASLNPTDAFTSMQTASSPNIGNSQKALVTLVDLMGHSERHAQDLHGYMVNSGVSSRQLRLDPKYKRLESDYAEQHSDIAKNDPTKSTPRWYSPMAPTAPVTSTTAPTAPTAPRSNAPSRPITLEEIQAEQRRRQSRP